MKSFAMIGNPIEHSLSPVLFNAGFKALNLDCIYKKEEVSSSDLPTLIEKLKSGEYSGFGVTAPFKEEIIQYVDELTPEAKATGAVNSLYILDGKIIGENTDWIGFKEALTKHTNLENKKILIYGAGGAARACLFALKKYKENIFLTNIIKDKGIELSEQFEVTFVDTEKLPDVDIFINATSISLDPKNGLIVPEEWLKKVSIVFDLVYGNTVLNIAAKKLDIQTIDAKEMLLYQAIPQFKTFTSKEAPAEIMAKAIGL